MSAELKFAQDRIQNMQYQAQIDRELRAAKNQDKNARVFKLQLPRLFNLSRKHA
jgi:hypothetical protein